ncbi:Gfo/Idh/MocA family oxidoreductase [Leptothoe spongobia TAU-MAC 1115]|uniref:Gfo/Idh/MocA family oxidoreductase n=2 Tax=Leptothoe TaxID=2651725 RepID=A0A947GKT4_9CYAN|nr:Gfo/Idh/MocA family oxidoreductase [Leptothoe spongobia TAU-MAC 1115]
MNDPTRLGIVGAGSISLRGLLPHLTQSDVNDRVVVTAICDPVLERAQAAAQKFGVDHAFATHGDLFTCGHVDAVTIASPIGFHYQQGKQAIAQGLHIHFNKTMTTTVAEATELIELAHQQNVKIVASPGEMLRPLYQQIRRLILEGALGTPTWAIAGAAFGQYHEQESVRQGTDILSNVKPDWYFRAPGGGPLYDMAVYGLHVLTGILGPAKRVTALSGTRIPEREFHGRIIPCNVDDNTLMLLDYGNSLYALVYGVAAGELLKEHVGQPMIFGTHGVISGHLLNGQPIEYPNRIVDIPNANYSFQPHVVGNHRSMEEAHVYEDIMQLIDWIREDRPSIVTAEHACHVIEIIEAAYRAAETGITQNLQTTFESLS